MQKSESPIRISNQTSRKTQMRNPTLPSTDPCLNLGKNAVRRNYFPFAVLSSAGDFLSDFYYHKFINIHQSFC